MKHIEGLLKINRDMIPSAVASAARAFETDPYIVFLIPDVKKRSNLHYSFEFFMRMAVAGGSEGYTTSDRFEGVAIWRSSLMKESWSTIFHAGNPFLPLRCGLRYILGEMRINQFCVKLRNRLVSGPYMYLALLAVDPSFQGKGFASSLVKPMLKRLDDSALPCYLETQNSKNVQMYQHFGFKTVYEGIYPGIPTPLYAMLRKPGA
jgi:ribosomal protein S18 acetylase RimI-like enzyme